MKKLCNQPLGGLPKPEYKSCLSALEGSVHPEMLDIINESLSRLGELRPPPNRRDGHWAREMQHVVIEAALEIERDHSALKELDSGEPVSERIWSKVRRYWRKERRFWWRTARSASGGESERNGCPEELPSAEPTPDQAAIRREVWRLVMLLPQDLRILLVRRHWLGYTQAEEAKVSGIDRCTVSRRNAAALAALHDASQPQARSGGWLKS